MVTLEHVLEEVGIGMVPIYIDQATHWVLSHIATSWHWIAGHLVAVITYIYVKLKR